MQAIAFAFFWILVVLLATAVILVSFAMHLTPGRRDFARALRSGTLRSVGGVLIMQLLSFGPFVVLLLTSWFVQHVAERFGASPETATWMAVPIAIPALLLPPVATLVGAYLGFRRGWLAGVGRDPDVELSVDPIGKRLRWLGPVSPERW